MTLALGLLGGQQARANPAPAPLNAEATVDLYPQANEFREVLDLSGLWDFKLDPRDEGERRSWWKGLDGSHAIAVPGSWSEQIDGAFNYMGPAWYARHGQVPRGFAGQRVFLRVGSANYGARVWLNGVFVGAHEGGHLPLNALRRKKERCGLVTMCIGGGQGIALVLESM